VIGLSAVIASAAPGQDREVEQALMTVLGWAGALWRTAFFGVLGLAVVLVVDVVLRRRWDLLRDLLVALLGVGLAVVFLGQAVESDWLPIKTHLLARWGYPEPRLAGSATLPQNIVSILQWERSKRRPAPFAKCRIQLRKFTIENLF